MPPDTAHELRPDAPESDPTWNACLAQVTSHTLLAFDYESALAPSFSAALDGPLMPALQRLLGIAGARTAIVSSRPAEEVRNLFVVLAPLAPAFFVGQHGRAGAPAPYEPGPGVSGYGAALETLVEEGSFDRVLLVGAGPAVESAFVHPYSVPTTTVRLAASAAPTGFTLAGAAEVPALVQRLTRSLRELAPAESIARP